MANPKPEKIDPDLPDIERQRGNRPLSKTEDPCPSMPTDDRHGEHRKQQELTEKAGKLPPGK